MGNAFTRTGTAPMIHPASRLAARGVGALALACALCLAPPAGRARDPQAKPDGKAYKIDPLKQSITVNANITTEVPASIVEIGRPQLEQIPGVNLDDRLRYVPGFSMFRRSS